MSLSAEFRNVVAAVAELQDEYWLTLNAMANAIDKGRAAEAAYYGMELSLKSPEAAKTLFDYVDRRCLSHDINELFQQVHGASELLRDVVLSHSHQGPVGTGNAPIFHEGQQTMPTTWAGLHKNT